MKRIIQMVGLSCLAFVLALGALACSGGGETAVIGFANDNNTLGVDGLADEVAEALAENQGTPRVTDEMIAEIFGAILDDARQGNSEAALIVLKVAEEQREADEG